MGTEKTENQEWLNWFRKLQSLAQTGKTFAKDPFEVQRYEILTNLVLEIGAKLAEKSLHELQPLFQLEKGYPTPKVGVRGVLAREGKILLVREKKDQLWCLPGGFAEVGTSPKQAVENEVFEESGYQVKATKLLALRDIQLSGYPPDLYHHYRLIFLCEFNSQTELKSLETDQAQFFMEKDIPELSLTRSTPEEVSLVFRHLRNPGLAADFE